MRLSDLKIQYKILLVAAAPTLLAAAVGGVALWGLNKMADTSFWVDHTVTVLDEADGIVSAAVNMETGMRGFAIAGEDAFLEPYIAGKQVFTEKMGGLQQTVSDNPPQVARLKEAEAVMMDWETKVAESQIAMRRTVGTTATMDDVVTFAANAGGKVYFDKFRGLMKEFIDIESGLMVQRKATNVDTVNMTYWSIIGGIVAAVLSARPPPSPSARAFRAPSPASPAPCAR